MTGSPLRRVALGCHVVLTLTIAFTLFSNGVTLPGVGVAVLMASPLLAMLYALWTRRTGAERWIAVLLVPYAGALSVEVVARAGGTPLLGMALLVCVLEITLLLAVIRSRGRSRDVRG